MPIANTWDLHISQDLQEYVFNINSAGDTSIHIIILQNAIKYRCKLY